MTITQKHYFNFVTSDLPL